MLFYALHPFFYLKNCQLNHKKIVHPLGELSRDEDLLRKYLKMYELDLFFQ